MKKFLILSLVNILIICMSPVYAQTEEISINCVFDSVQNCFTVSGSLQAEKSGDYMVLYVYLDDALIDVKQTYSVFDEQRIKFYFAPVSFSADMKSGTVRFRVQARHIASIGEYLCQYYGAEKLFEVLKYIEPTLTQEPYQNFLDSVEKYKAELGVDIDRALLLSESAITKMMAIIKTIRLDLPQDADTEANIEKAFLAVQNFRKNFQIALIVGSFYEISNVTDFNKWYSDYASIVSLDTFDKKAAGYLLNVQKSGDFITVCKNTTDTILTQEDMQKRLAECCILAKISLSNAALLKEIIDTYPERFVSSYAEKLTTIQKEDIITKLAGSLFYSYSDLMVKYDEYAAELLETGNKTENSGGGKNENNGGNWGKTSGSPVNLPVENDEKTNQQDIYAILPDLKDAAWAGEAVSYLYRQNIISGKSAGIFAPNDNITRAEFIKLAVSAAGVAVSYSDTVKFDDVSENEWYYPYVMTARKNGITEGNGDNKFNPRDFITREDMTVILYRIFSDERWIEKDLGFTDKDEINDYAVESISYWFSLGVINGMEDGSFRPDYTATRAQAAQAIYKIVTLK